MTQLNGLGLHSLAKHLMERVRASKTLEEKFADASQALNDNNAAIKRLKVELGEQTKYEGRPIIIQFDDYSVLVPVPPTGYTDYPVDVQFIRPKGINNL